MPISAHLQDADDQTKGEQRIDMVVEKDDLGFCLHAPGYGLMSCQPGTGGVVFVERYKGELRVLVWGDIQQEDPTHIISLGGAQEGHRDDDSMADSYTDTYDNPHQEEYVCKFETGQTVKVERQDDQWGRIAEQGIITEENFGGILVLVGGNIRANVLCQHNEVFPVEEDGIELLTLDEVVQEIAEMLLERGGEEIAALTQQFLDNPVRYKEDSIFERDTE